VALRPRRTLVLGCGGVAQCTVPLLVRELGLDPASITVVDFADNRHRIADILRAGVKWEFGRVTRDNLDEFLSARLGAGDLLLDLAWNIDTPTIVDWCHGHDVRYLNTSVELWDPYDDMAAVHPNDRTLYVRHQALRAMSGRWSGRRTATAVVEHGANPGLVSHFAKQALGELAGELLRRGIAGERTADIEAALAADDHARLAMHTGTRVIHVSERDTQLTSVPKRVDEFVNTWSVEGFYEEGVAPAELGWGTHEKTLPRFAYEHRDGPRNQICIAKPGMETVPSSEIHGMVIRHGEAYTMCEHLSVYDDKCEAIYRPTVHYAYCPTDAAIMSVQELRWRNWEMQPKQRILNDEIDHGRDELGVLLMGHPYKSWWFGSCLSIEEARAILPHQSATTLQVACSVVAAVQWMFDEPERGLCVPDNLPYDRILGTMFSGAIDWDPLSTRKPLFPHVSDEGAELDHSDPWQFCNFLV